MSQIDDYMTAAATAIAAGNYATALSNLRAGRALLSAVPDVQATEGFSTRWDRNDLDRQIADMQKLVNASQGVRRTKLNYRSGSCGDDH